MFSNRNPALVSHSDGMFTRYSATTTGTNDNAECDLIAFLSIVQKCNIDYLPLKWQPALSNLGTGGCGTISQSTFIANTPLAFKRFHDDRDFDFLSLISEVLILSQSPIRNHPNIINLEGICWEIKPTTEEAVPVLVFEKAAWDLQQFMNAHDGRNMSINDQLRICADIGSTIMTLHAYGLSFEMKFACGSLTHTQILFMAISSHKMYSFSWMLPARLQLRWPISDILLSQRVKQERLFFPNQGHGMLLSIILESSMSPTPKKQMCTHLGCCVFGFC
jgi:hypothetical protein